MRLTFYHRYVVQPPLDQDSLPWEQYGSVFDDVAPVMPGSKSPYIFTQVWFQRRFMNTGDVLPDQQYRWEFVVDQNAVVVEDNKTNNNMTVHKTDKGYDHLVMGKNHW